MMGRCKGEQGQLFYAFDLEAVVPDDHQVTRVPSRNFSPAPNCSTFAGLTCVF